MSEPIRVDPAELTLGELADLEEQFGMTLEQLMASSQARGVAGIVWVIRRRTVPEFTLEDAFALKMTDLEIVTPDPEAPSDGNGATPLPSRASGI